MAFLEKINSPADTKQLAVEELIELAREVRSEIISAVSETGGHLTLETSIVNSLQSYSK